IVVGATFEVVRQQCLNDHGDLASVHSNYENDFLVALVDSTYPNNDIFIGLEYNGNNWYWSDGTQVDYTNWGSNQPNDESSYPCTILRGLTVTCNGNQGLWQNQDCTTTDSECANRVGGVCKFAATY
uniref:C-type lectin domain-containing protein n=1 Tax=Acrobeloides nanus TaxID=290746 RepID=A0A914DLJ8_9BILA